MELSRLFGSKSRTAVISLLLGGEELYIQEVVKRVSIDPANVHRELKKLEDIGIVTSRRSTGRKYYQINDKSPYFEGLKAIFNAYRQMEVGDRWFLMEDFPNGYPTVAVDYLNVKNINAYFKSTGIKSKITKTLTRYQEGHTYIHFLKGEFDQVSREMVGLITSQPDKIIKLNKDSRARSDQLVATSKKIRGINLAALSNKELNKVFQEIFSAYEYTHISGWSQNAADFGEGLLSKCLMDYLKRAIQVASGQQSVSDAFIKLTTPTEESHAQKEYKNLLEILKYIEQSPKLRRYFSQTETRIINESLPRIDAKLDKAIRNHAFEYGYLGHGLTGPAWDRPYFIDVLSSLVRQKKSSKSLRREAEVNKAQLHKDIIQTIKTLGIDAQHQKIFDAARSLVAIKGYRKDSMFFCWWVLTDVLKEIGKRFYLSIKQVRFVYPHEMSELIIKGKFNVNELNGRFKNSICYSTGDYRKSVILSGPKADAFTQNLSFIEEQIQDVKQLNGDTASPGKARGKCKIVNLVEDMDKMGKGDILISIVTSPELVPAIKKASAIVTNTGGITCHAAIISRELGIPCVIGTKIATKVLHDGDIVEVDATHGKVTIIKKA
ncbi:hypothetical protein A2V68_03045 [candidate division Kazan bacterium RBG_13_50_9]|uniref:HTH arsR-type domain-containing protein n=1 Tax=candidate division Kazan bacterium RBG_13_50_9 TaxID=1798535 RepID=A0A1F4NUM0_UNCK3|nr:MAG: hypothetical protein A2V68_03045 [candidate division Kazan bacterium RBG_13_50_9]